MPRPLERLQEGTFDVLVIGGGVLGVLTAREAARSGLRTALVERAELAAGASGATLRILHGGLRYLASGNIARARRCSRALASWHRSSPRLVDPLPVLVPGIPASGLAALPVRAGLRLAAFLVRPTTSPDGPDRRSGSGADLRGRQLPVTLSGRELAARLPALAETGVEGGVLFRDGLLRSAREPVREARRESERLGATTAEHVEVRGPLRTRTGGLTGVTAVDLRAGGEIEIRARAVVNATGASAPDLARILCPEDRWSRPAPIRSLNVLVEAPELREILSGTAVALASPAERSGTGAARGRRRILVVPRRDRVALGTAHLPLGADPERAALRFVEEVNEAWSGPPVSTSAIRELEVAPLASERGRGGGRELLTSPVWREHGETGESVLISVQTDKYTTAPLLAARIVARVTRTLERKSSGSVRGSVSERRSSPAPASTPAAGPADGG